MPFHSHLASEEALFVLVGAGMLRLGTERSAVAAGDYVAFVPGSDAHQLTNTGADPLRYLVFSTKPPADVIVYPDSDKVGAMAGEGKDTWVRFFPNDGQVDYWNGEPTGGPNPSDAADTSGGAPKADAPKADAPKAAPPKADDDDDDDDDDLEQRIDDEIAALKKKLGLAGKAAGKSRAGPKRGTAKRKVVDDALDELERLKRTLDGD